MTSSSVSLGELLAPVQGGLRAMRTILAAELTDSGPVGERIEYLGNFRGKELRAALVLLAGKATGNDDPELPHVAAVLELIHLATLVHDDVLDGADLRRNQPSVHTQYDEQTAILLGDMLYSRAFHLSTRLRSILAARVLSQAAQRICAGEMEQAALRYSFDLPQERYEAIASAKTAELYGAACELGAHYPASPETPLRPAAASLRAFGMELGLAFQITDDLLDLTGNEREVGKRVGNDVDDGKVTLAVLHTYAHSGASTQAAIRRAYQEPGIHDRLAALHEACDLGAGVAYARARAQELLRSARSRALQLDSGPAQQTLLRMADYLLDRKT
ncbi:MAG: polyprenyl synthetase family protein [Planctomycetota bacterium]